MDTTIEFELKFDAICIYICTIAQITILGYSDHQTDAMIEFTLKFDAICIRHDTSAPVSYSDPYP
jgi:hypothetical protein